MYNLIIFLTSYFFTAYCLYIIGKKTGHDDAWLAFVPIGNVILMIEIAGQPMWWIVLIFLPFVNLVILILIWMGIAAARGFPSWYGILVIIPFIDFIILGYMAFSDPNPQDIAPQTQSVATDLTEPNIPQHHTPIPDELRPRTPTLNQTLGTAAFNQSATPQTINQQPSPGQIQHGTADPPQTEGTSSQTNIQTPTIQSYDSQFNQQPPDTIQPSQTPPLDNLSPDPSEHQISLPKTNNQLNSATSYQKPTETSNAPISPTPDQPTNLQPQQNPPSQPTQQNPPSNQNQSF